MIYPTYLAGLVKRSSSLVVSSVDRLPLVVSTPHQLLAEGGLPAFGIIRALPKSESLN